MESQVLPVATALEECSRCAAGSLPVVCATCLSIEESAATATSTVNAEQAVLDEKAMYIAFQDIFGKLKRKRAKKAGIIKQMIETSSEDNIRVNQLVKQFGMAAIEAEAGRLIQSGLFLSPQKAAKRFPELFPKDSGNEQHNKATVATKESFQHNPADDAGK